MYRVLNFNLLTKENNLYGLAFSCPYLERKRDCPFMKEDLLPFKEKVIWIQGLGNEEKIVILKHHIECSNKR